MFNLFGTGGSSAAQTARALEDERAQTIKQGVLNTFKSFSRLNSAYYNKRAQDYVNYAMPRLGQQAQAKQKSLVYQMNNQGLASSSVASEKQSQLNQALADEQAGIVDAATGEANQQKVADANQRSLLIQQLLQAQTPTQRAQGVMLNASNIQLPDDNLLGIINGVISSYLGNNLYQSQVKGGK